MQGKSTMKKSRNLHSFCIEERNLHLLSEWDTEKNAGLTPENVPVGSHKKVWWRCEKEHSWKSEIRVRVNGARCPCCAGRTLWIGDNDLATVHPALAAQWDTARNGVLRPADVLAGSQQYVWWRCKKGHSWRASILNRARGSGCPVCSGKITVSGENDLLTLFPALAAEWNIERNGGLTPDRVTPYSNRKAWWRCSLGHEWQSVIASRVAKNAGCSYCTGRRVLPGFNDLATRYPRVAAQWDATRNGSLTPEMVTSGSHKRIWWKCSEGHVWKAVIYSRTSKSKCGCPICAGKVR